MGVPARSEIAELHLGTNQAHPVAGFATERNPSEQKRLSNEKTLATAADGHASAARSFTRSQTRPHGRPVPRRSEIVAFADRRVLRIDWLPRIGMRWGTAWLKKFGGVPVSTWTWQIVEARISGPANVAAIQESSESLVGRGTFVRAVLNQRLIEKGGDS